MKVLEKTKEDLKKAIDIGINLSKLPKHIGFIMDGNGRWAVRQGQDRSFGHRAGVKTVKNLVKCFRELGIPFMTIYAFSTENWNRPKSEVNFLMNLFSEVIEKECQELKKNGVRVRFIGRITELNQQLQEKLLWISKETESNSDLNLTVAFNYGGRAEIIDAVKNIVKEFQNGNLKIDEINDELFSKYLYTYNIPDPDLIIRTSGEIRVSNFLLWQIAYAEIFTTPICWPEFSVDDFLIALYEFQNRQRRFGR